MVKRRRKGKGGGNEQVGKAVWGSCCAGDCYNQEMQSADGIIQSLAIALRDFQSREDHRPPIHSLPFDFRNVYYDLGGFTILD